VAEDHAGSRFVPAVAGEGRIVTARQRETSGRCEASFQLRRDDGQPWPGGDWQRCGSQADKVRVIPVTAEVIVVVRLCDAHDELWESAGPVARIALGPLAS
jgi:hypothetical protein